MTVGQQFAVIYLYTNHTDVAQPGRGNSSGVPVPRLWLCSAESHLSNAVGANTGHLVLLNVMSCSGCREQILHPISFAVLSVRDIMLVEEPVHQAALVPSFSINQSWVTAEELWLLHRDAISRFKTALR